MKAFKYPLPEKVPLPPEGLELGLDAVVLVVRVVCVVELVDVLGVLDVLDVLDVLEDVLVVLDVLVELDIVETGLPDLGRYLIPVDEQLDVCPTGDVGTKVPVCTEPWTS